MRATETVYSLPDLVFRGGSSQKIVFNLKNFYSGEPFDLSGGSVIFSANDYINPTTTPALKYTATLVEDASGEKSVARISILPDDTKCLRGKYVYQLTLKDSGGEVDTSLAGLMVILENNYPDAV